MIADKITEKKKRYTRPFHAGQENRISGTALSPAKILLPAVLIVLLATATVQRNAVWQTMVSLWSDAAQKSPRKSRTHNNLGNCYMLLNMPFEAIEQYRIAVALDSRNIEAYYNLGMNYESVGILNQAAYYYDFFCKSAPHSYRNQKEAACERAVSLIKTMKKQ